MTVGLDEREFVVLLSDGEFLSRLVAEGGNFDFSVGSDSQHLILVQGRNDLVDLVRVSLEFRGNLALLPLVAGLRLLHADDLPHLVSAVVDIVLQNWLAFNSLTSGQVQSSVASVSLEQVTLVSVGSLLSPDDIKPAAIMLAGVGDDLGSVILLVSKNAEGLLGLGSDEGKLAIMGVEGKLLEGSAFIGMNFDLVVGFVDRESD